MYCRMCGKSVPDQVWQVKVKKLMTDGKGLESILVELSEEYQLSREDREQVRIVANAQGNANRPDSGGVRV